jgi:GTP cyclohydrolase II
MDDIKAIAKKFSKDALVLENQNLLAALEDARKKITELEIQLALAPSATKVKTSEEIICELEIEKIKLLSQQRPLTVPETKQFEIYVKSLYLIRGKSPETFEGDKLANLEEAKLLEIVKG